MPEFPHGPGNTVGPLSLQESVLWPGTGSVLPGTLIAKLPDPPGWDWRGMPGYPASVKDKEMVLFSLFWPCQEKFDNWDRPQKLRQGQGIAKNV